MHTHTRANLCSDMFHGFYAGGPTGASVEEVSIEVALDVDSVGPKSKSAFTWMCGFSNSAGTEEPVVPSMCFEL